MKQKNSSNPPRVAVYVRVGSIQQLFRSNAEMVRHLFKELLEDGKEHSNKEIIDYIFDKTRGRGVKDGRLTEKTSILLSERCSGTATATASATGRPAWGFIKSISAIAERNIDTMSSRVISLG